MPNNIIGRIVIQYDMRHGVDRKLPNIGHAYKVTETKGKQLKGKPLGTAPTKAFLNLPTLALVCDTNAELAKLCKIHNTMQQGLSTAIKSAHSSMMKLAGLPVDDDGDEDVSEPNTGHADTPAKSRQRKRSRAAKG